jgi:hypothetical protein
MREINVLFISATIFISGCQKTNPSPNGYTAPTTTVIAAQSINNSFTLSSTASGTYTYNTTTANTTTATEETQSNNGINFYILTIVDNNGTLGCEFWFANKPSPGTYYVSNFKSSYTYGVSSNSVAISVLTPNTSQSTGTINVSISGIIFIITASGALPVADITTTSDVRSLSTTAIIP